MMQKISRVKSTLPPSGGLSPNGPLLKNISQYAINAVKNLALARKFGPAPFKAAYFVANGNLHFHERGHIKIIESLGENFEEHSVSHYGWFKIIPHPNVRGKHIFIIDQMSDYNKARSPETRFTLNSINDYYAYFYSLLIKSGIKHFSLRIANSDKRSPAVNERNWQRTSQLLADFHNHEKEEEKFIKALRIGVETPSLSRNKL